MRVSLWQLSNGKARAKYGCGTLVTGVRSKVLVAALRGRETGAVAEMRAGEELRRQTIDQDSWDRARERERVIKGLLEGEGDLEARIIACEVRIRIHACCGV